MTITTMKPLNQNKMENRNQSAYPVTIEDNGNASVTHLGLTKREYFAAMAMQGILASNVEGLSNGRIDISGLIPMCVMASDALLKALETKSE